MSDLQYALDRMSTPLDPSRLSGATADEDARCMSIIRAEIERLRAACTALAALVQRDRVALYEAHHYPHSGEIDDEGREALAEYDAALALADQAMGSEG